MENQLSKIFITCFRISIEDSKKNLRMIDLIDWDSLTHMNLIVLIEKEFNIELTGDEIAEMVSFYRIREIIQNHL